MILRHTPTHLWADIVLDYWDAVIPKRVASGAQFIFLELLRAFWSTQNPETESVRGFFITYRCQRLMRMLGRGVQFSGLGERVRGAVATIWLQAAVRRNASQVHSVDGPISNYIVLNHKEGCLLRTKT